MAYLGAVGTRFPGARLFEQEGKPPSTGLVSPYTGPHTEVTGAIYDHTLSAEGGGGGGDLGVPGQGGGITVF